MSRWFRLTAPFVLALAVGGCMPGGDASTYALPSTTLAPVRLLPCPARVPAAASATHCPQDGR